MQAIHLKATARSAEWAASAVTWTLRRIVGVKDVAVLASLGVVSVLFDERVTTTEQILAAARRVGFDAKVL